jgi:thymidylate kinase
VSNPFAAFEGLSGSGKTTLAKKLAARMGGLYYKTPAAPLDSVREAVDASFGPMSRFLFYFTSVARAAEEIPVLLREQPVICDRYILSTSCYHLVLGVDRLFVSICEASLSLQPDFTFLVVCKDDIRRERMRRRGMTPNDHSEQVGDRERRFLAEYRARNVIEIDNSADDPEIALGQIISVMGGIKVPAPAL